MKMIVYAIFTLLVFYGIYLPDFHKESHNYDRICRKTGIIRIENQNI